MKLLVRPQQGEFSPADNTESELTEDAAERNLAGDFNLLRKQSTLSRPIQAAKRPPHIAANPIIVPVEDGSESIPVGRSGLEKGPQNFPTGKLETRSDREGTRTGLPSLVAKTGILSPAKGAPAGSQIPTPTAAPVRSPLMSAAQLPTESKAILDQSDSFPMREGAVIAATNEPEIPTFRSPRETSSVAPDRDPNFSGETQVMALTSEPKIRPTPFPAHPISERDTSSKPTLNLAAGEAFNGTQLPPSSNRSPASDASSALGSFIRSDTQSEPKSSLRPEISTVNLAPDNRESRGVNHRSPVATESAPFEFAPAKSREARGDLMTSPSGESHLPRDNKSQNSVRLPASLKVAAKFAGIQSAEREMRFEATVSEKINMQDNDNQSVKNRTPAVGINPAFPSDNMSSTVQSPPPTLFAGPVTDTTPVTRLDTVRMIERIDSATAQLTAQKGKQVDLKIDLESGQQLSVRLTMNEGQVRASFQTDHPALRESLAAAWPTFVAAQRASNAVKWVDPVFAPPVVALAQTTTVTAGVTMDSGTNFSSSPQHEQTSSHGGSEREESSLHFASRSKFATPSNSGVTEKSDDPVNPRSAILPGLRVFA